MGHFIFDQLSFVRQSLLNTVKGISESQPSLISTETTNMGFLYNRQITLVIHLTLQRSLIFTINIYNIL